LYRNFVYICYILRTSVWRLRVFFACSLLWLLPLIACGSFAPRPTPIPTNTIVGIVNEQSSGSLSTRELLVQPTVTPILLLPTSTLQPEALPTATQTPIPGTVLSVGQPARVGAPTTLNVRDAPNTSSQTVIRLDTGRRVQVVGGPVSADGYTWWEIDDRRGHIGWAADGDGRIPWLNPSTGEVRPVDRSPQVGDRVVVSVPQLKIRSLPAIGGSFLVFATSGQEYSR